MIQIHDSKKKGDYSIRVVQRNGKITSDNSGFGSELAVVKNIVSNANTYKTYGFVWEANEFDALVQHLDIRDCTKSQYFAQKYGCKKHVAKK
jgi:hypothetical protein